MLAKEIMAQIESMTFNGKKCAIRVWVEDEIARKPLYEGVFESFEELYAFVEGPEGHGPDIPPSECGFERVAYALVEIGDGKAAELPLVKTYVEPFPGAMDLWDVPSDELIEQIVLDYLAAANGEKPADVPRSEVIDNCNDWMSCEDARPIVERLYRVIDGFGSKGYKVKRIEVTPAEDVAISFAEPYAFSDALPEGFFHSKALDAVIYQFGSFQELDITEEELLDTLIEWIEGLPEWSTVE